jgi:hypothetical protein
MPTFVSAILTFAAGNKLMSSFKNIFDHDLNAFLKWEKLGKSEEDCPRFRNLLAVNKVAMGQKVGGQPSMRETIKAAIVPAM